MTHYTVITARPVMRAFDDAMKAIKVPTDEGEEALAYARARSNAVKRYSAAVKSGNAEEMQYCEYIIGLLMKAEAKESRKKVQKGQGLSDQQAAGQRRASGVFVSRGCKEALLKFFQESPVCKLDDIEKALPFKRTNIIGSIKYLRKDGYEIKTTRPRHGAIYHFHGKQEATQ